MVGRSAGLSAGRLSFLIDNKANSFQMQLQLPTGSELGKINHFGSGVYNDHYNHQLSLLSLLSYVSLSTLSAFDPLQKLKICWFR